MLTRATGLWAAGPRVSNVMESSRKLGWVGMFAALLVLECVPVWTLRHFPSQDGPSHLYNAAVLANWNSQPLYRQYYEVRLTPAGNLLFQLLLAAMIKTVTPTLIEPLLLTTYIVLFSLAFLLLLKSVSRHAWPFSLFAFIFVANNFYQMGFWNFIFSIPLTLLALRYYLRGRQRASPLWLATLTLWGLLVYEMHMASWMVLAIALGLFSAGELLEIYRKRSEIAAGTAVHRAAQAASPLLTLLPPLALTVIFMAGSGYRSVSADRLPETLLGRVTPLAALSFFRSLSDVDLVFTAAFGILAIGMAADAVWRRLRTPPVFQPGDMWLVIAFGCAAASVLAPSAASGVFIRHRLAYYSWLFLVLWLSTQPWRPVAVRWFGVSACLLAALPFLWRIPEYNRWERAIDEFATVGERIRPDTTVLALDMQDTWHRINPLLHAVNLFALKPFVDLRNYEAATAYFPTQFRPGLNPFDSLGTLDELQHMPPEFHLARYEEETHSPVNYLLFYGPSGNRYPEQRLYGDELRRYKLIYISQPAGIARLYQRIPEKSAYPIR